ncbi:hypothetical protein AALO_G00147660 [Alosa alosa]|uniref:RSE1/DDB1/CPSF1 second beta-propeller domain-containing protein n=1 Tax=Alosa alosa TaxID=278164 RepID=A0AAV6GE53_9TELE|nr:hypothetical protein AALO_G00147660 [Alosa alosa]
MSKNEQIANLANEDTPQLYVACGRGPRSTLRVLRHGLEVSEMAVSELPGNPNTVWTVRRHVEDEFDAYIIVSFVNATLVLSIGETVEEVTDSGFLGTTPTLSCSLLGEDALVQVDPDGIRHIRADKRVNEWKTPGKKTIMRCAVNQRQVVIALTGGELVYFEMDPVSQLNEYTERKEISADVVCMSLANVPQEELPLLSRRAGGQHCPHHFPGPLGLSAAAEYAGSARAARVTVHRGDGRRGKAGLAGILALEKLGAVFNQVAFPLQYTPRKFVIHPETNNLVLIETDHNAYTEATKAQRKQQMAEEMVEAAGEDERELAAEMAAAFLNEKLPEAIFGAAGQPHPGHHAGPSQTTLDLEQNEAAFSVAICRFSKGETTGM